MGELLAPAGSYESIIAAVNAGADAVYAGGRMFGARAYADNPDEERLIRGMEYCHLHGRKLYLTVNTLLKERELEDRLYPYLLPYYENGVDGLIVQDFGVMRFVREHFPDLPVHASTQMTVTGPEGARMLKAQGVSRVVAARELSLEEIRAIVEEAGVEVEAFIHGAMCYSYSGQCLFSSMLGGRSGNRGRCAQPCRLPYRIRGGQASCLLSMKDMCTLDFLPELLNAGIASFKIEGRMKRPEYTAGVVEVYRKYLDLCRNSRKEDYHVEDGDRSLLLDLYNRGGFSGGYYHSHNGRHMISTDRPNHMGTAAVSVRTGKDGTYRFTAIEPLGKGDVIELSPGREVTLGKAARKSEQLRISAYRGWRPEGRVLFRTKNAGLLERLRAQYLDREIQERVNGTLHIPAEGPAVLELSCGGVRVGCSLEIAEPARKQPVDAEFVRRQMQKTGNTAFEFDKLDISLADGLFIPAAKLNELRRTGLSLLRERLLEKGRRQTAAGQGTDASVKEDPFAGEKAAVDRIASACAEGRLSCEPDRRSEGLRVNVLVTTEAQLEAVLECGADIDTVYLDSLIFGMIQGRDAAQAGGGSLSDAKKDDPGQGSDRTASDGEAERRARQIVELVKRGGRHCFLSSPAVLRERERRFLSGHMMQTVMREMDGFLLHTVDGLACFSQYIRENGLSAVLAADDNLYAYNRRAAGFLVSQGVGRFTFPAELNFRELAGLVPMHPELNIYGYQALMQSAQCVVKNTDRCTGIPGITCLTDRKGAEFPVLNRCPFCYNTVYNSVPLMLCGCREEILQLAPEYVRLSFTVESKEETARVIAACMHILAGEGSPEDLFPGTTTRGHFRRGVE